MQVKQLAWEEYGTFYRAVIHNLDGDRCIGYCIWFFTDTYRCLISFPGIALPIGEIFTFDSLREAKKACQEHYENFVMSQMEQEL